MTMLITPSRVLVLAFGVVLVAGCGASGPATKSDTEAPTNGGDGAQTADPAERVAAERARIEALIPRVSRDDATGAGAFEDDGGDVATSDPGPDDAADLSEADGCSGVCAPADGICGSAEVICDVAERNPGRFDGDCDWAVVECTAASQRCDACR